MPELPDVTVYIEHLERRLIGARLGALRVVSPHLLRTVEPGPDQLIGRPVREITRLGKRIVFSFGVAGEVRGGEARSGSAEVRDPDALAPSAGPDRTVPAGAARPVAAATLPVPGSDLFLVIHLMIAGRFQWRDADARSPGRGGVAVLTFDRGTLVLTEAGTRKRTSMHVLAGRDALADLDPGGIEPLEVSRDRFAAALRRERHTLKRSLTDPRIVSGIGNAYSDEILHRARLSPLRQTHQLEDAEIDRLYEATRATLAEWTDRLRAETGERFPTRVTAFRDGMAVHGRYRQPCPDCGAPVQRIVYAENETNYCARCQTGGRLLADRALSRLLRSDFPRTLEALEEQKRT